MSEAIARLDAFIQQLENHDYSFGFSDDGNVRRAGVAQRDAINAVLKGHPELTPVHAAYYTYWWDAIHGDWKARKVARDAKIAAFRNSLMEREHVHS